MVPHHSRRASSSYQHQKSKLGRGEGKGMQASSTQKWVQFSVRTNDLFNDNMADESVGNLFALNISDNEVWSKAAAVAPIPTRQQRASFRVATASSEAKVDLCYLPRDWVLRPHLRLRLRHRHQLRKTDPASVGVIDTKLIVTSTKKRPNISPETQCTDRTKHTSLLEQVILVCFRTRFQPTFHVLSCVSIPHPHHAVFALLWFGGYRRQTLFKGYETKYISMARTNLLMRNGQATPFFQVEISQKVWWAVHSQHFLLYLQISFVTLWKPPIHRLCKWNLFAGWMHCTCQGVWRSLLSEWNIRNYVPEKEFPKRSHAGNSKPWQEMLVVRYSVKINNSRSQRENLQDRQEMPSIRLESYEVLMMQEIQCVQYRYEGRMEETKEKWRMWPDPKHEKPWIISKKLQRARGRLW